MNFRIDFVPKSFFPVQVKQRGVFVRQKFAEAKEKQFKNNDSANKIF